MGTTVNFIKQLEERRKAGLDVAVEDGDEEGNFGTRIRKMVGTSSTGKPEPRDIALLVVALVAVAAWQLKDMILEDYFRKDKMLQVETELSGIEAKLQAQNQKLASYEGIKAEIESYEKQEREFNEKLSLIKSVRIGRNSAVRMIDYIVKKMPSGIWLSNIDINITGATGAGAAAAAAAGPDSAGKLGDVKIDGYSKTHQDVSLFLSQLEGTSFFPTWQLEFTDMGDYNPASAGPTAPAPGSVGGATAIPFESKKFKINAPVVQL